MHDRYCSLFFLICNKLFQTYKIISSNNAIFLLADNAAVCLDIAAKHASNGQHSIKSRLPMEMKTSSVSFITVRLMCQQTAISKSWMFIWQTGMTPMLYGIGMPIGMHFLRSTSYI